MYYEVPVYQYYGGKMAEQNSDESVHFLYLILCTAKCTSIYVNCFLYVVMLVPVAEVRGHRNVAFMLVCVFFM